MKKWKIEQLFYIDGKAICILPCIILGDWFNEGYVIQTAWLCFVFTLFFKKVKE